MAQGVRFKNSGVWKSVEEIDGKIQTKVSGTWKNVSTVYYKQGGAWLVTWQPGAAGVTIEITTLSGHSNHWHSSEFIYTQQQELRSLFEAAGVLAGYWASGDIPYGDLTYNIDTWIIGSSTSYAPVSLLDPGVTKWSEIINYELMFRDSSLVRKILSGDDTVTTIIGDLTGNSGQNSYATGFKEGDYLTHRWGYNRVFSLKVRTPSFTNNIVLVPDWSMYPTWRDMDDTAVIWFMQANKDKTLHNFVTQIAGRSYDPNVPDRYAHDVSPAAPLYANSGLAFTDHNVRYMFYSNSEDAWYAIASGRYPRGMNHVKFRGGTSLVDNHWDETYLRVLEYNAISEVNIDSTYDTGNVSSIATNTGDVTDGSGVWMMTTNHTGASSTSPEGSGIFFARNPGQGSMAYLQPEPMHWQEFSISPAPGMGERGVFSGGRTTTNLSDIQYFNISVPGNPTNFGTLFQATTSAAGVSNGPRGMHGTGYGFMPGIQGYTSTDHLDVFNFYSPGNSTNQGNLTAVRHGGGAASDGSRAVFAGGNMGPPGNWAPGNLMDYIEISSNSNATEFGDLFQSRMNRLAGMSDSVRGVFGGGQTSTNYPSATDMIDYVTIATPGNALEFGALNTPRQEIGGCSDGASRGVWAGGQYTSTAATTLIDYVTMSTPGNAATFGDLTLAGLGLQGTSNGSSGVFGARQRQSGKYTTMDYITIATTGNATSFGTHAYGGLGLILYAALSGNPGLNGSGKIYSQIGVSSGASTDYWNVVADDGTIYRTAVSATANYEGASWTEATPSGGTQASLVDDGAALGSSSKFAYGNNIWVCYCKYSANNDHRTLTSSNGTTWTTNTGLTFTNYDTNFVINAIKFYDGKFVAISLDSKIWSSTDGVTWTFQNIVQATYSTYLTYDIAYGNGMWAVSGASGNVFTSDSLNGIWKQHLKIGGTANLYAITYVTDNGFIAAGEKRTSVYSDVTGNNWNKSVDQAQRGFRTNYNADYWICNHLIAGKHLLGFPLAFGAGTHDPILKNTSGSLPAGHSVRYGHVTTMISRNFSVFPFAGSSYYGNQDGFFTQAKVNQGRSIALMQNTGAKFDYPRGIAVDSSGNVYVADTNNCVIKKILPTKQVISIAGRYIYTDATSALTTNPWNSSAPDIAANNRPGGLATFRQPWDIVLNHDETALFVSDKGHNCIKKIDLSSADYHVSVIGGVINQAGNVVGDLATSRFYSPLAMAYWKDPNSSAESLYVGDMNNGLVYHINLSLNTSDSNYISLAKGNSTALFPGSYPSMYQIEGLAVCPENLSIFASGYGDHTIKRLDNNGAITTIAGLSGTSGTTNGSGTSARFKNPAGLSSKGMTSSTSGCLYLADMDNGTIRKIDISNGGLSNPTVSTIMGEGSNKKTQDGSNDTLTTLNDGIKGPYFRAPYGIDFQGSTDSGDMYVSDRMDAVIRKHDKSKDPTRTLVWSGAVNLSGNSLSHDAYITNDVGNTRFKKTIIDSNWSSWFKYTPPNPGNAFIGNVSAMLFTKNSVSGPDGFTNGFTVPTDQHGEVDYSYRPRSLITAKWLSGTQTTDVTLSNDYTMANKSLTVNGNNISYKCMVTDIAEGPAGILLSYASNTGYDSNQANVGYAPIHDNAATVTDNGHVKILPSPYTSGQQNLWSIVWAFGKIITVGDDGSIYTGTSGANLTSTDNLFNATTTTGVSWITRTSGTTETLRCIRSNGSIIVAVGDNGTIVTSTNGNTWTVRTSNTTKDLVTVCFSPDDNSWMVGGESLTVLTSLDGITWTQRYTNTSTTEGGGNGFIEDYITDIIYIEYESRWLLATSIDDDHSQLSSNVMTGVLMTSSDTIKYEFINVPFKPLRLAFDDWSRRIIAGPGLFEGWSSNNSFTDKSGTGDPTWGTSIISVGQRIDTVMGSGVWPGGVDGQGINASLSSGIEDFKVRTYDNKLFWGERSRHTVRTMDSGFNVDTIIGSDGNSANNPTAASTSVVSGTTARMQYPTYCCFSDDEEYLFINSDQTYGYKQAYIYDGIADQTEDSDGWKVKHFAGNDSMTNPPQDSTVKGASYRSPKEVLWATNTGSTTTNAINLTINLMTGGAVIGAPGVHGTGGINGGSGSSGTRGGPAINADYSTDPYLNITINLQADSTLIGGPGGAGQGGAGGTGSFSGYGPWQCSSSYPQYFRRSNGWSRWNNSYIGNQYSTTFTYGGTTYNWDYNSCYYYCSKSCYYHYRIRQQTNITQIGGAGGTMSGGGWDTSGLSNNLYHTTSGGATIGSGSGWQAPYNVSAAGYPWVNTPAAPHPTDGLWSIPGSPGASTWSQPATSLGSMRYQHNCEWCPDFNSGNGYFLSGGWNSGGKVSYSADGVAWSTSNHSSGDCFALEYGYDGNGIARVLAGGGGSAQQTQDGVNWISLFSSGTIANAFRYLAVYANTNNGHQWIVGGNGQDVFATDDCISWYAQSLTTNPGSSITSGCWDPTTNRWIIGINGGNIQWSSGGPMSPAYGWTWNNVNVQSSGSNIAGVDTDGQGNILAVDSAGAVFRSTDGGSSWVSEGTSLGTTSAGSAQTRIKYLDVPGTGVLPVWIVMANNGQFWECTQSTPPFNTWTNVFTQPNGQQVTGIAAGDPGGVWTGIGVTYNMTSAGNSSLSRVVKAVGIPGTSGVGGMKGIWEDGTATPGTNLGNNSGDPGDPGLSGTVEYTVECAGNPLGTDGAGGRSHTRSGYWMARSASFTRSGQAGATGQPGNSTPGPASGGAGGPYGFYLQGEGNANVAFSGTTSSTAGITLANITSCFSQGQSMGAPFVWGSSSASPNTYAEYNQVGSRYNYNVWRPDDGPSAVIPGGSAIRLGARGVFAGGRALGSSYGSNASEYITIDILNSAVDSADLVSSRSGPGSTSDGGRGLWAGGFMAPGGYVNNSIEYKTIMAPSLAGTTFGNLTSTRIEHAGTSDGSRGVFGAGNGTAIDYVEIGGAGVGGVSFGNLTTAYSYLGACSNGPRGVFGGGLDSSSTTTDVMDYITIATPGNAANFGTLSSSREGLCAVDSYSGRGVFAGGNNVMDYVTIATLSSASSFGTLTASQYGLSGVSNGVRGVFNFYQGFEYITIDTTGNSVNFGTMTISNNRLRGGCSGGIASPG